jgi:hypothetical protein
MFTNAQALLIVNACLGHSPFAEAQALEWAALVARTNASHRFSDWSIEEAELIRLAGSNPDLVEALGHQTPAAYLDEHRR